MKAGGSPNVWRTERLDDDAEVRQAVERLEALARLMEVAFVVPGTNLRFGMDALIGLVPVAGDMIGGVISSYLIWQARRLGAPRLLVARMVANALIDTAVGSIPVLGDSFDVLFRSNMRNMRLLRGHLERRGALGTRGPVIEGHAVRVD